MRITEAAARLGMSPRMLRYREDLGLLPPLRDRPYGRGHAHRQFTEEDLAAITAAISVERRFDITPAALAFGLRVLTDPAVRAAVADLGRRTGHVPAGPGAGRALDFEKERALRALSVGGPNAVKLGRQVAPGPGGTADAPAGRSPGAMAAKTSFILKLFRAIRSKILLGTRSSHDHVAGCAWHAGQTGHNGQSSLALASAGTRG